MSFVKDETRRRHFESCELRQKRFECSTCGKRFYKVESLFEHIGAKHKNLGQIKEEPLDVKVKIENFDE